ncbi:valine--tRNA ligase [Patescibacteria group bacterium]
MDPKDLPKAYEPNKYESSIYKKWEDSGFFNPDNLPGRRTKLFSIAMPPPNATGTLHIGHAVTLAIEDIMTRYARMRGYKTLWLPGTDHAAIATQNVIEKQLKEKGQTKHDLGREVFEKRVEDFVEDSKSRIRQQIRALGASCDWSRERYTMDQGLTRAVQETFVKMYNDGLIYRGNRIVNWCPRCQSTLADDEVEYKEQITSFYYFKYGPVTIGTARPETKFSDKIIIVHPDDKRYKHLVGREFDVEWIDGKVKARVIADKAANPQEGSGAMTITPGHSFVDFDLAKKHNLPIEKIIDEDGKLTAAAGELAGSLARESRVKIVSKLEQKGLVDHIDENYKHNLSICYRCHTPIEPLVSNQWFISVEKPVIKSGNKKVSLKHQALRVVKSGEINIIPKQFIKVYFHWLNNLHDWNISRQLWFGHRIPVWYCGGLKAGRLPRLGFHESVLPQLFAGKTKTYRLRDHGFAVGDIVAFDNSQQNTVIGHGTITAVEQTTIDKIRLADPEHGATYKKLTELVAAFKRHHPDKKITATTPAWIYKYKFVSTKKINGCGQVFVGAKPPDKCPACSHKRFEQDTDVLDTWFSSALWTFSTLGWPDKTKDLKTFHPTTVMETGYDILFFWVARMILMTTYIMDEIPFETVYLHGLVRDKQGRKMSKSLGNGIDPLEMSKKYSADAVRLSLVIGTSPGNDMRLYEEKIAAYRNFGNKIWNIARYAMLTQDLSRTNKIDFKYLTIEEKSIIHKLNELIKTVTRAMDNYSYGTTGELIYNFIWHDFADVYLEETKARRTKNTSAVISLTLRTSLKLLHPFMPFVTEHIWEKLGDNNLLMISDWPKVEKINYSPTDKEHARIVNLVSKIRNTRALMAIPANKKIDMLLASSLYRKILIDFQPIIKQLAQASRIEIVSPDAIKSVGSVGGISYGWTVSSDIKKHLRSDLIKLQKYITTQKNKLGNKNFAERAPKEIVSQENQKLAATQEQLDDLNKIINQLG